MAIRPKPIPHPRFERVEYLVAVVQSASVTGRTTAAMNLVEFYYLAGIDPYTMICPKYYKEGSSYPISRSVYDKCATSIEARIASGLVTETWHDELMLELRSLEDTP